MTMNSFPSQSYSRKKFTNIAGNHTKNATVLWPYTCPNICKYTSQYRHSPICTVVTFPKSGASQICTSWN